jgi:hypothetical protein
VTIPVEGRSWRWRTLDAVMSDRPYRVGAALHIAVRELWSTSVRSSTRLS